MVARSRVVFHFFAETDGTFEKDRLFKLVDGHLGDDFRQRDIAFRDPDDFLADRLHLRDADRRHASG